MAPDETLQLMNSCKAHDLLLRQGVGLRWHCKKNQVSRQLDRGPSTPTVQFPVGLGFLFVLLINGYQYKQFGDGGHEHMPDLLRNVRRS